MDSVLPKAVLTRAIPVRRRWLMVFMLGLLHAALVLDIADPWARALLLSHFGMFLLWQPLWSGRQHLTSIGLALIALAAVGGFFFLNWWVLAFWVVGLFGLVGGKVFSFRATWLRVFHLAGMAYLLAVLLVWIVPHLFETVTLPPATPQLMFMALPAILVAMAALPVEQEPAETEQVVDFFYSLMLSMLAMVLVLGAFAVVTVGRKDYFTALIQTLFIIATLLLFLGLLWNPRFGFSGLQQMLSRYLLNVGTPFEQWISQLSEAAGSEEDPSGFLEHAARRLAELPWVDGVRWHAPDAEGSVGRESPYRVMAPTGQLSLELFARYRVSPAVALHTLLLGQIVGRFYEAKQREKKLSEMTRLQAIHETGARLTHDVKNLLQSLYMLASAAQQTGQAEQLQQLLRRQLPLLTQRLELTLKKLKAPQATDGGETEDAAAWWELAKARHEGRGVEFRERFDGEARLPVGLFDCVIDNLLDNVRKKRMEEPEIAVSAELVVGGGVVFAVHDTGSPVPPKVADNLFRATVESESGMGIGLYQVARWARQEGYRLRLANNEPGNVRFELVPETKG